MEILILCGCFFFVLTAVLFGGYWFLREPEENAATESGPVGISLNQDDGPIRQTLEKIGSIVPAAKDLEHPLRLRLISAGYREPDALQALFGIKAVLGLLLCLGLTALSIRVNGSISATAVAAICGAGMGYLIPGYLLNGVLKRRRERLRRALPAALDLLVLGLEAGQGLDSSLMDTSRELKTVYPELSEELALAHLEMRAGQSRAEVLERLAQRTGEPEIRKLTGLLLDGDRFGTSLGPAIRNHAAYTRMRRRQIAQEQARKTGVKLVFPVFFLIFPCVLLVTLGPAVLQLSQGMNQMLGGKP